MSDEVDGAAPRATAGSLLRAARERQGLHIAALAAAIKVAPRKLDALEHDRYDELPDATFTRALAQTVCRSLKIDPAPVLALLPVAEPSALDHVSASLNAPFRERPGRSEPGGLAAAAIRPMVLVAGLFLAAAAAVYFVPASVWQNALAPSPTVAVVPAASPPDPAASVPEAVIAAASAPDAAASAVPGEPVFVPPPPEVVASAPAQAAPPAPVITPSPPVVAAVPAPAAASAPASAVALKTLLQLRADEASWVEIRDGRGQVLLSRTVQRGESVGFDAALPIRMTIGNAPATRVSFRGKPVDLAASTRDSVAKIELQ